MRGAAKAGQPAAAVRRTAGGLMACLLKNEPASYSASRKTKRLRRAVGAKASLKRAQVAASRPETA